MAVLSAADRRGIPEKQFAGPGRSFPIEDKTHARMAISGATRSERAGNISPEEEARIKAKAREKLGDKGGDDPHKEHRIAIAKMHPGKLHQHVMDAAAGKYGPEAQRSAQQIMQPAQGAPAESQGAPQRSPFSGDNDQDDQQPASGNGNPFAGGQ